MQMIDCGIMSRYSNCYEQLRALCTKGKWMSAEAVLRSIEATALYASTHHPGRLFDGAIENIAIEIGRRLDDCKPAEMLRLQQFIPFHTRGDKRRILHVSPEIYRIGGHTRTLRNWIRIDHESQHSLVLTQRGDPLILPGINEDIRNSGGNLIILPPKISLLAKARLLREIAHSSFDLVVLHHTCNDIIPVVAFATSDSPPVAFVNDCDQAFWLGNSIADIIVNQRDAGVRLSIQRRFTTSNIMLPIPLSDSSYGLSRNDARQALGIPHDQLMLLSVGRALKYRPTQSHNFFQTVRRVLDSMPKSHLYVVGLSEIKALQWQLDWQHPRIHLCGTVSDPSTYQMAADIYLESFPFGSATALLEVAQVGVPVVLPFAPPFDLFVTNHGIENIVSNPTTEDEYINRVNFLLKNTEERELLGQRLKEHVRSHHTGVGWRQELDKLYLMAKGCKHSPRLLTISELTISDLDIALCEWQAFLNGDIVSNTWDNMTVPKIVSTAAYLARKHSDYRVAFELLLGYLYTCGYDKSILRSVVKLPVHKILNWAQNIIGPVTLKT